MRAGKKDASEVLVQGGVLEDLGRYLVQQYGVPKKYIEVRARQRFRLVESGFSGVVG